jgi:tetratricopeptide (TPR) repeat protein
MPAWPVPSGAPTLSSSPPVAETPVLPVPYGSPAPPPASGLGEAHWLAEGEPALVAAAHAAVDEQRFADAVRLLEEFLGEHPEDARAWHRLAGARIGLQQYATALAAADRSIELDPECAPAHLMRGIAVSFLSGPGAAEQSLARSITLDPGKADAHALLALALSAQGRVEAATDAARAALAINPAQQAALRVLARHADATGRWMPLVTAGGLSAGVVLVVLTLMLAGSPSAPVFAGFAVVAFLPLFAAVLRWAVGRRAKVARALPRGAFPVAPIAATAFVAVPVLLTGTDGRGTLVVLLLTAAFAASCTAGVYRKMGMRSR